MTALIISQILLWLVVLTMAVVIVALTRQLGVLHERLAPMGALAIGSDLIVGDAAPRLSVRSMSGATAEIGLPLKVGEAQLLLFVSPNCPVCKKIIPVAQRFGASEKLKVLFVGDGDEEELLRMIEAFGIDRSRFVNTPEVGIAFRVSKLPYAVLIDHEAVVSAKGLVNSREHLESLVVARETGYASIQSYLTANNISTLGD